MCSVNQTAMMMSAVITAGIPTIQSAELTIRLETDLASPGLRIVAARELAAMYREHVACSPVRHRVRACS